jgi:predicted RNA polymerase sigma factor
MPREPEVRGLLALMELQASRLRARVGSHGEPVLLADQDRARWDHLLVQRGLAGLRRAEELSRALGPYVRGDVLVRLGRLEEAREEFERAADLCNNERERKLLRSRAVACGAYRPPTC